MNQRTRKLIGTILIVALVIGWSLFFMSLAQGRIAEANRFWQMLYYVIAGLGWTIPAGLLIKWMQRADEDPKPKRKPTKAEIKEAVFAEVRSLCPRGTKLTEKMKLVDDLKLLGNDTSAMVLGLEREFGIRTSDADYKDVRTVGDVIKVFEKHLLK